MRNGSKSHARYNEVREMNRSKKEHTHHERINKKIVVFEGIENRGCVDAISACFAEFKRCHHGR